MNILSSTEELVRIDLGEDLSLQQLDPTNADEVRTLAISNREHLLRFKEYDDKEFDSVDSAASAIANRKKANILELGLRQREILVGRTLLVPVVANVEISMIAYWVAEAYTNRGYATKAAKGMVAYAFKEWSSIAVAARVLPENTASKKVLERTGLKRVDPYSDDEAELWIIDHPLIPAQK